MQNKIQGGEQLPLLTESDTVESDACADLNRLESWCRLIRDRRWSRQQKVELLKRYKSASRLLNAPVGESRSLISGRMRSASAQIEQAAIDNDLAWLSVAKHGLVTLLDRAYPEGLRQLPDPPIALFFIGDVALLNDPQVAIVGSRSPTPVGAGVTGAISQGLARAGVTITSGMALGIDGVAHTAALDAGGSSIAVLGNGLDTVYPSRNRALFERLSGQGLLVSEYPLGFAPSKHTFPQRNRIVSGLAQGVVIVEAAERSGTLITARLGLEQNKEVMVVPGSALSSQYRGSHQLINQGASLVSGADDVLRCLSMPLSQYLKPKNQSDQVATQGDELSTYPVLKFIGAESTAIDHIVSSSNLTSAEVSSMLLELELIGAVAIANDGGYVNLS